MRLNVNERDSLVSRLADARTLALAVRLFGNIMRDGMMTVFGFSMVMIVLNQTASQLTNRMLDQLIGSRFQQAVLGIYVGTIVYSLFLLST